MLRIKDSSIFFVLACILGVIVLVLMYLYGEIIDFIYIGFIFFSILFYFN